MESEPSTSRSSPAILTPVSEADVTQETDTHAETNRSLLRSCIDCNRRKIRCDKREPCSTCLRAGSSCVYPPPGPRIRRSKKTIVSDMSARIESLEKSLAKFRAEETSVPKIASPAASLASTTQLSPEVSRRDVNQTSRDEIIVGKGSSSQYFNEVLLSSVIREVSIAPVRLEKACISVILTA
jgi:hypothetical protein